MWIIFKFYNIIIKSANMDEGGGYDAYPQNVDKKTCVFLPLPQFTVTCDIILHSSLCNKLIFMLEIKLGVNLEVKLGVGSETGSKNSVVAFLKCTDRSVLAFLKCTDGSVLVFLKCMDVPYWPPQVSHAICPHQISTAREFRGTIAIMQEKH